MPRSAVMYNQPFPEEQGMLKIFQAVVIQALFKNNLETSEQSLLALQALNL